MISKARDQILGEYFLNSFIIKCNVDIDFENLSNSDSYNYLGSFFHEYIHFLQNASTTYGNMNMAYFYAKTMNILYQINKNSDIEVKRIIHDNPEIQFSGNFCNLTMGDFEPWTYISYDLIKIVDTFFETDKIYGSEYDHAIVPRLNLQLVQNGKKEIREFNFGALAIMESMASLLERHLYNKRFIGAQLQYDICMILWNHFAPQYANRTELVLAACEYSLMYDNPGSWFYNVVKYIISKNKKIININDIRNVFKTYFKPNFEKLYSENFDEMNRLFSDLIPPDNEFCNSLNAYVCNFCNKIFMLRKSNNNFLSDLMVMDPNEAKRKLISIIKDTEAIPLIISNKNEIFSGFEKTNKMGMINYLVIYSFNKFFGINGENNCYMIELCKVNTNNSVNDKCVYCPWEKVNEEKLCPMAQIWYMWNLQGKKIID